MADYSHLSDEELDALLAKSQGGMVDAPASSPAPTLSGDESGLDFLMKAAQFPLQAVQASLMAPVNVAQSISQPAVAQGAQGLETGLKQQSRTPQSGYDAMGQVAGKYGPKAALPLAGGFLTGGMGYLPAVGFSGLMAAGSEGASQTLSAALGGNSPETSGQAMGQMAGAAKSAATMEAGLGGGIRVAKAALPAIGQVFANRSGQLIKKGVENPSKIPVGRAVESVEKEGVEALGGFQAAAVAQRKTLGTRVSQGVEGLFTKTKGGKVVDLTSAADKAEKTIEEAVTNPIAGKLVDKGELKAVQEVMKAIRKNPVSDVKTANAARDLIDDAISWKKGTVPKVQSEVGQRALRALRSEIKDQLNKVATSVKDKDFIKNNSEFHEFAEYYDDVLQPQFGTRSSNTIDQMNKMDALGNVYRKGGLRAQEMEKMGNFSPAGKNMMGDIVTNFMQREFTGLPMGTPSGTTKDVVKMGLAPRVLGRGIYHGAQAAPVVRGGSNALSAALGSEPPKKKKKRK